MIGESGSSGRTSKSQIAALFVIFITFLPAFYLPDKGVWQHWDKLVHTFASAALAVLFYPYFRRTSHLIVFVLIIGVLFEVGEFWGAPFGTYGEIDRYIIDTILDLAVDVLGAIVAVQVRRLFTS